MRSIIIDEVLSIDLFSRIKPHLPETYNGYTLEYLNSHFRFSKYDKNGKFPIHVDGKNYDEKKNKEGYNYESLMTLNIFLNDDFEGGQTDFFFKDFKLRYSVEPKAGRGALFYHKQLHRGNKVLQPYKYLIRTDVMGIQI
jgi:predicted 2-oxoglutarate/Fe(II)-dependent dioxygenase YbiX